MAGKNDINSTEKLLNVIRGKDQGSFEAKEKSILPFTEKKSAQKSNFAFANLFSNQKRYTVGIDIGKEFIQFAKSGKGSDGRPVLVDQKIVKYSPLLSLDSSEFKSILKSALIPFCGSLINCNIWTIISENDVNVQHIKIPRAPKDQLENVIYWTAKKESPFDEKESIFDYEMQGEIIDQGIPKYSVMVYTVPKSKIEKIKTIFTSIGITLDGITIAPFAIQNIFRTKWAKVAEATFASLFIGRNFSRIDIYHKENLVMTRGIKTGISSMTDEIAEVMSGKTGKKVDKEEAKKILLSLVDPGKYKLEDIDIGSDLKDEDKFAMITTSLERLSRQVERTLEHYVSTAPADRIEKIYISLAINSYDPILNYISDQLSTKVVNFDAFEQQSAQKVAESLSFSEKVAMVPVLGLSFSDNSYTPNAIFNYQSKNRELRIKKINKGIFISFAIALIISSFVLAYQVIEVMQQSGKIKSLENEFAQIDPNLAPENISALKEKVKVKNEMFNQYSQRHLGMALIADISSLTPDSINLIKLKISMGNNPAKENSDKSTQAVNEDVVLEGVLRGDRKILDQYVAKLEESKILHQVLVQKSSVQTIKKEEVLYFTISGKIG